MAPTGYSVATDLAYVRTDAGVVTLGQGDPLPEGVSEAEVARLANGGVLEGYDVAPSAPEGNPAAYVVVDGTPAEVKTRVGDDPVAAAAYLEVENQRETPRGTLVKHLEGVIAAGDNGGDEGQGV